MWMESNDRKKCEDIRVNLGWLDGQSGTPNRSVEADIEGGKERGISIGCNDRTHRKNKGIFYREDVSIQKGT